MNSSKRIPDIIFFNGKVVTVDERFTLAKAVAVRGDRFLAVGDNEYVKGLAGPKTKMVDLDGKTVVPGFIDGHQHFQGAGGIFLSENKGVSLAHATSIADIQLIIKKAAENAKPGDWIVTTPIGEPNKSELIPESLKEKRLPNRWDLDTVSPKNPVWISVPSDNYSYSQGIANSYALKLANVTKDTPVVIPNPAYKVNGEILKDPQTGEPTGIFQLGYGFRTHPIGRVLPASTFEESVEAVKEACKRFSAAGVTSVMDIHSGNPRTVRVYQEAHDQNALTVRITNSFSVNGGKPTSEVLAYLRNYRAFFAGMGDDMFKVRGVSGCNIDAPPNNGQCLQRFEYIGLSGKSGYGVQTFDKELHKQVCLESAKLGLQVMTKASGGGAIDMCLENYEEVNEEVPIKGLRWMMQHCPFISKENVEQCRRLGVIPLVHTNFLWNNGSSYVKFFGREVTEQSVPIRWLLDAGVKAVQASDSGQGAWGWDYQPMFVIWQAISRKDGLTGKVLGPDQSITREEALRIYTINGAYSTFEEDLKGSIEPGKLADMVILSKDILACPLDDIKDTKVLMTMLGGKTVYENK